MPDYRSPYGSDLFWGHPGPPDPAKGLDAPALRLNARIELRSHITSGLSDEMRKFCRRVHRSAVFSSYQRYSLMSSRTFESYVIKDELSPCNVTIKKVVGQYSNVGTLLSYKLEDVLIRGYSLSAKISISESCSTRDRESVWNPIEFIIVPWDSQYISVGWEFIEQHFHIPGKLLSRPKDHWEFTAKSKEFCRVKKLTHA